MRMTPQSIQQFGDALLIEGPSGPVLVKHHCDGLETSYRGDQLVNGSALAYSRKLLEEAIEYTNRFPLPWVIHSDGSQKITDHKRFYEQTFDPDFAGIEMLKRWIHYLDSAHNTTVR
jgi:hypothetical protein